MAACRNGRIRPRPSRYSPTNKTEADLNAWPDGQAAWGCDGNQRRRDLKDHALDAGRDDGRGPDLAIHAGAGAAGAGDDVRARHFDRTDDGVALYDRDDEADHGADAVARRRCRSSRSSGCRLDAAADRGNLRDLASLRLDHDLHHATQDSGRQRGTDRKGGGGRVGDALAIIASEATASPTSNV